MYDFLFRKKEALILLYIVALVYSFLQLQSLSRTTDQPTSRGVESMPPVEQAHIKQETGSQNQDDES